MSSRRIVGTRVGAILSESDDGVVKFLGYGAYEGDFVPEEAVGWIADAAREYGNRNPRIRLDSGKIVYGCECWWAAEGSIKKRCDAATQVVEVDIDVVRSQWREQQPKREATDDQ